MKKKFFFIAIGILLFAQAVIAQTQPAAADYPSLKTQAEEVGKATLSSDFAKLADLTYPKIVESLGGKEKMVASLKSDSAQMIAAGVVLEAVTIGEIKQIAKVENQIFALVPLTMKVKTPSGTGVVEGTMVGVSNDDGANWKFISGVNQEAFKGMFPKAAEKIKIPDEQPPKPGENE